MNVKKAIQKIVALGSGLTMIGATIMGATADLGDYPAPFVQDGVFAGKIIVGSEAATSDVLGAIDISASLQAASKVGVSTGTAAATTTVEGGVLVEDSSNQDFNFGDSVSTSAFDNGDFPDDLADGLVEDDDGVEYDFSQEVAIGNLSMAYDLVDNDVYSDPVIYLDLDNLSTSTSHTFLTFTVDFDSGDELDVSALDDSESIEFFGQAWTFKNIAATDEVVLYGSDQTVLVAMNSPVDVEVDDETYTLNIVGANSDTSEVHVSVNGQVKSMTEGNTKTISGLKVYVQDVFVSTIGGESASASLFVGSREINLGSTFGSWVDLQIDNEDVDGVEVFMTGNQTELDQIDFRILTTEINNDDTDEDYDWLALGDSFVDPLFGWKVVFAEAVPSFMSSSRDYVDFKSSNDDLVVTFTNADGTEYEFSPYQFDSASATSNLTYGEDFNLSAQKRIAKNAMFILEESSTSSEPNSRIFEFTGADLSDDEASFKDIGSGQTLTVGTGDALADTGVTVTIDADDLVNLSSVSRANVYTSSGANISFETTVIDTIETITVTEDAKGVNTDEVAGDSYTVAVTYDTTDNEVNVATPALWDGESDDDDNGDYQYGVGAYGTFYTQEAEDNTRLELWIPMEDVDYNIYVAPPGSSLSSTGASGSTYYTVSPIGVGVGVLDTDAPALGSTPMIVVGGPCANTVAAELMGSPANCVEGFEAGKAVIKFYADDNAILVAGYSAMDTQGASRVLADYADWDLDGSEVEVLVPSLSRISEHRE
jgi:hypothetical protein